MTINGLQRSFQRSSPVLILARAALLAVLACPLASQEAPPAEGIPEAKAGEAEPIPEPVPLTHEERIAKEHESWLQKVEPFISRREKALFQSLRTAYQKDAFINRFWQVRDPYPRTARNELRERWERRVGEIEARFGSFQDDRARVYLVHGPPASAFHIKCTTSFIPAEIWTYDGSEQVSLSFALIFLRPRSQPLYRLWTPDQIGVDTQLDQARRCLNGGLLMQAVSAIRQDGSSYLQTLARVVAKPKPRSQEWLATFVSMSTDLPAGAETFAAEVSVDYLGRYQSRTVTQGVIRIPLAEVGRGEFAGYRSYDLLLTGEVVAEDRLFENFRYKFDFPVADFAAQEIPLAFQRYLRPGSYTLLLKLEDLHGGRFFRHERTLEVPKLDEVIQAELPIDPESAALFEEATAAIGAGTSVRIVPPPLDLLTGFVRFDTLAVGEEIEKVSFLLDDRLLLTKNRPPYNVEIDLGPFPRFRELRVEAFDAAGGLVADDELLINSGGNRFSVELVEPTKGGRYERSLLARAEVVVPEGRTLDRVELFLDEARVATLYQKPFVQPITLPQTGAISYVRAVAYLPDGNSTEDLVFINAPDYLEEVGIQFVELYTSVLDRQGRPVQDLGRGHFRVLEDGVPQSLVRFERVGDLPIHVGILIDNSGSMRAALPQARVAALRFFEQAISPRDRAAVITFNRLPNLAVKLTNDLRMLGGGLAGLTAEGETALYDSVMFGLYYFTGIKGQRALLLLSDGKDEVSRFTFEETMEYARRAGVTIYTIGLDLKVGEARTKLVRLAEETGGRSFFIRRVDELEAIYTQVQEDLRSQYLLAYQSTNTGGDDDFRAVELELTDPGMIARTISGYYP